MLKPPQVSIARDPVTVGPSQTLAGTFWFSWFSGTRLVVCAAAECASGSSENVPSEAGSERAREEGGWKFRGSDSCCFLCVAEAWQEMVKHGVNRCPVTVSGRGVGMISRRDLRIAASIAELDVKKGGPVDDMVKDRLMQIKVRKEAKREKKNDSCHICWSY